MLSIIVHLHNLRWILPMSLVFGLSPWYISLWGSWRLLTAILPNRLYHYGDDKMYSLYQRLIIFSVEHLGGLPLYLYGDVEEFVHKEESAIYLANHQSTADWIISDMLAVRQGSLGHIRYILKDGLRYFPLYGFYFKQHGCVYVKRSGKFTRNTAESQIAYFKKNNIPVWLVIFPEGTRYKPSRVGVIEKSQQFARDNGLSVFENVLTPRVKALQLGIEQLRGHVHVLYDLTVCYGSTIDVEGHRTNAADIIDVLEGKCSGVHIHMRRINMADIPSDETEQRLWLDQVFVEKDRLMSQFYSPDPEIRGKFPGKAKLSKLSLLHTVPPTLFWAALFIGAMATSRGRSLYWKAGLVGGIGGWMWMCIRQ